ncbi:LamG domain-containing protein, partial [candidate division TA06 bacterium]|nr:LamG domain-containing protein [candidate division TA06 bacterium]
MRNFGEMTGRSEFKRKLWRFGNLTERISFWSIVLVLHTTLFEAMMVNGVAAAFPTGWGRKCELVIQFSQVDTNLTNFPVLLTKSNLFSEMFDADGPNPALNGGGDIRFSYDSAGTNRLFLGVVDFTTNNDPALGTAELWVNVPSVSSSVNTSFWVWYNKAGESQPDPSAPYGSESVWDANYKGIWHLQNDFSDATSDSNDGTNFGSTDTTGKIGDGQDFPGVNEYIEIPNSTGLENIQEDDYTIAAWFKPDTTPSAGDRYGIFLKKGWHEGIYYRDDKKIRLDHWLTGEVWEGAGGADTFAPGSYYFVVSVVNRTNGTSKIYVNGSLKSTNTWTPGTATREYGTNTWKIGIGNPGGSSYRWAADGVIDEVRISNTARFANWISTQYNNQNSPSTFVLSGNCD